MSLTLRQLRIFGGKCLLEIAPVAAVLLGLCLRLSATNEQGVLYHIEIHVKSSATFGAGEIEELLQCVTIR